MRNFKEAFTAASHKVPANGPVIRQLAFMSRLDCRHSAILGCGNGYQLLRAPLLRPTYVQVISYKQKKRLPA
jgi:hypothetical protein